MRRRPLRLLPVVFAITALAGAPSQAASGDEQLLELTLYSSHEEVVVRDAGGDVISRETHHAGDDEHDAPAGEVGVDADPRCANPATYNYLFRDPNGVRTPRPWRTVEPMSFSTAQVPTNAAAYWRSAVTSAALEWERATNPCGAPDEIAWRHTTGPDTTFALSSTCSANNDAVNMVGFTNMGGWGPNGLLLGRACVRATSAYYTEGDIIMNNHADAVWCDGACSGGYDLWSLAAHEFGHYLGLGHVCNDSDLNNPCDTTAESGAVMYPWIGQNTTQNRTLSAGDLAGARSLYPAAHAFQVVAVTLTNPHPGEALRPGATYDVTVDARNTGLETWSVGTDTTLATDPAGRCSAFATPQWLGCTTATTLDEDATNEGPSFWPNSASVVIRDEVGRFRFQVTAAGAASVTELFRPVAGTSRMTGTAASLPLTFGTLAAEIDEAHGPDLAIASVPVAEDAIVRPFSSAVEVRFRNTGTAPWPLGSSVTVRAGRCSPFAHAEWETCEVAGALGANLSMPDKTYVGPNEVGTIRFAMTGGNVASGTHTESFALSNEGSPFGDAALLTFTVV